MTGGCRSEAESPWLGGLNAQKECGDRVGVKSLSLPSPTGPAWRGQGAFSLERICVATEGH